MALINTRDFGEIQIDDEKIITFPKGMFAFEDNKKFAFITPIEGENVPIWLQNLEERDLCFIIFKASDIVCEYEPQILSEDLAVIEGEGEKELEYYTVAVIPSDHKKTTVNLKSPIVINKINNLAVQAILPQNYELKHYVYSQEGE